MVLSDRVYSVCVGDLVIKQRLSRLAAKRYARGYNGVYVDLLGKDPAFVIRGDGPSPGQASCHVRRRSLLF